METRKHTVDHTEVKDHTVDIEFVHDVVEVAKDYISKGTNAHINEKLRGGQ